MSMDREQARQYIIARAKEHLQPDGSGKGYVCPLCGSGSGKKGTGITTKDGIHFTCWAGCFSNADIIDIIGQENGLEDYSQKLYKAAEEYGIQLEGNYHRNQNQDKTERVTHRQLHNAVNTTPEEEVDYTSFFLKANKRIEETSYHRGISLATLNRFKVGFVPEWRHPKATKAPTSPRLIIPTSKSSYLARDTRTELTDSEKDYAKSKVGKVHIFNTRALQEARKPIFVVEGELDALSIIDVGGEAIGLGSLSNTRILLELLEEQRPAQPFIIALDNETDEKTKAKVERATQELERGFTERGINFFKINPCGEYKDANEALNADREGFMGAVERAENAEEEALEAELEQLKREAVAYSLQDFLRNIEQSKRASFIPTGFRSLDKALEGGLYPGLYCIGAISSLGKTTFCLQVCDQIAQAGQDVLIFSLEMARYELIAKSVSRLTLIRDLELNSSTANAKTTRGILTGSRYAGYNQTERELIQSSIVAYGEYAQNIYITEGIGNVGVAEIREKVEKHLRLTGKAPVVLIDYLQILAPSDIRATDKQNTDKNVMELKRMSRDYGIPVIGISSFNRDNYTAPVNLTSFKESGAIEYSSDVLIGLQYSGMDYQEGETEKARDKRVRELQKEAIQSGKNGNAQRIQVKILKNRNGSKGEAELDFYPMFNYFKEPDEQEGVEDNGAWSQSRSEYR